MTTKPALKYTGQTPNPELDAARHDDELEAADALHEYAEVKAPEIVAKQFEKVIKAGDWFDKYIFAGGMSADELLSQAMEASNDAVVDAYAELMLSDAAKPLRNAITAHFAKNHSFTIYADWIEDQQ